MDTLRIVIKVLTLHCLAIQWLAEPVGSVTLISSAYHTYNATTDFLLRIAQNNPDLTRLYSIGNTTQGRPLWVLEMTANLSKEENPNIKFVSQIHGNAPLGKEVILKLIEYLINNYRKDDQRVKNIFSKTRIHFLPIINPDGYEKATEGQCSFGSGRSNARGVDLNRNFPWLWRNTPQRSLEPETRALIRWMRTKAFLASATLTSGHRMIIYPYDDLHPEIPHEDGKESQTPDDDLFKLLAIGYSRRNPYLTKTYCSNHKIPQVQHQTHTLKGIYNGATLTPLQGTMMDYNYHYHGCLEMTVSMDCCKFPYGSVIEETWNKNREALLGFMEDLLGNVRISVRNENFDITGAKVELMGDREEVPTPSANGFWWRLLPPKKLFYFKVSAKGYREKIVSVRVPEERWKKGEVTELNVVLEREPTLTTQDSETPDDQVYSTDDQVYSSDDQLLTSINEDNLITTELNFSTTVNPFELTSALTWKEFNLKSNSPPSVGISNSSQYHCFLLMSHRAFKITCTLLVLATLLTIIIILKSIGCFSKCMCTD